MANDVAVIKEPGRLFKGAEFLMQYTPELNKLGESALKFNTAVFTFTERIATEMRAGWQASQQVGMSLKQYQSLAYATRSSGGETSDSLASVAAFNNYLKNQNNRQSLARQGLDSEGANGELLDSSKLFTDLLLLLEKMPEEQAKKLGKEIGLNEGTLLAARQGMGSRQEEYQAQVAEIGFDPEKVREQTQNFLNALNSLDGVKDILEKKFGAQLAGSLAGPLERLTQTILANLPQIEAACTAAIDVISNLVGMVSTVINAFGSLSLSATTWKGAIYGFLTFIAGGVLVRFSKFFGALWGVFSRGRNKELPDIDVTPCSKSKKAPGGKKKQNRSARKNKKRQKRNKLSGRSLTSMTAGKPIGRQIPTKPGMFSRLLSSGIAKSATNFGAKIFGGRVLSASALMMGARFIPGPIGLAANIATLAPVAIDGAKALWSFFKKGKENKETALRPDDSLSPLSQPLSDTSGSVPLQGGAALPIKGQYLSSLNAQLLSNNPSLPINSPALQNAFNPNWLSTTLGDMRTGINSIATQLPQQTVNNIQQTNHCYVSGTGDPQMVSDKVMDNFSRAAQILAPRGV